MRRFLFIIIILAAVGILVFIFMRAGFIKTVSSEELKNSIEIVDFESMWVEKLYQSWPQKLILVPAIRFKVKNLTDEPLKYINFNANFRFKDDYENLGDNFLAAIRNEPVIPGEISEPILMKSNYGVEGKTLETFKNNPSWKTVMVKLYAQSKGSQYILIGEWEISKKIDFEEPEPVGDRKIKKDEEQK
ncbi:MAG: hypothetical protein JXB26_04550 [Candidatus Aminicenantes bacterium]|nr:hypothetical protein [Candidatus Aminicenantes bacterium]